MPDLPFKPPDPDFDPEIHVPAPDYVGAVEGWRCWRVAVELPRFGAAPKMYSAGGGGDYYWHPHAVAVAECRYGCSPDQVPGVKCHCVPLDTEILTQRGWLKHDEVLVGDLTLGVHPLRRQLEWTPVLRVIHNESDPVYRVGNDYWSARATGDHRWMLWTQDAWATRTTLELPGEKRLNGELPEIVTKAAYAGGPDPLTPTEAAIVAWLHTDGSISNQRIAQKKTVGIAALDTLLRNVPHTLDTSRDVHVYRIRTPFFRDLWHRALGGRSLVELVLSLSKPALDAFMEAAFLAEGHMDGTGRRAKVLTQNAGPVADALTLGVYLQGYRPNVHVHDSDTSFSPRRGVCRRIRYCWSPIRGSNLQVEHLGNEPTWCVTTGLGSWTMRQDEKVLPTQNCGFYSAKTFQHLMGMHYATYNIDNGYVMVLGQVSNWGRYVEGAEGWRSQKCYPKRLWVPYTCAHLIEPLRETYGVPVGLSNWLKPRKAIA